MLKNVHIMIKCVMLINLLMNQILSQILNKILIKCANNKNIYLRIKADYPKVKINSRSFNNISNKISTDNMLHLYHCNPG